MSEDLKQRAPRMVMMSAHALCPTEMAHPDRMQWMAEYFMAHYTPASPAGNPGECEEVERNAKRYLWLKMSAAPGTQRNLLSTPWARWDQFIDDAMKYFG